VTNTHADTFRNNPWIREDEIGSDKKTEGFSFFPRENNDPRELHIRNKGNSILETTVETFSEIKGTHADTFRNNPWINNP
jgi:hypothetical protein